jgi:hypothetical protein
MNRLRLDTTDKLWNHLYRVRVPYLQSRTIEDIQEKGTVISGITEYDRDIQNQWMTTYLSISQMADYFKEGVPIRVCNVQDTKDIYESISLHISAWKSQLEKGMNIGDAPIEDLVLLDKLANTVYAEAKYQIAANVSNDIVAQQFQALQSVGINNFFRNNNTNPLNNTGSPDKEAHEIDRESLGDFFKSRIISGRRW